MDQVHSAHFVAPEALGTEGAEANQRREQDETDEDARWRAPGRGPTRSGRKRLHFPELRDLRLLRCRSGPPSEWLPLPERRLKGSSTRSASLASAAMEVLLGVEITTIAELGTAAGT